MMVALLKQMHLQNDTGSYANYTYQFPVSLEFLTIEGRKNRRRTKCKNTLAHCSSRGGIVELSLDQPTHRTHMIILQAVALGSTDPGLILSRVTI